MSVIQGFSAQRNDTRLQASANEAGLMPLANAFSEVLQEIHDRESDAEMGGGMYRELIPMMVTEVLVSDPKLGVGNEIYKELKETKA